jgi:transcription initiation factor TFIIIB Brf1 subunit/transcription initiation factor TFIIB
MLCGAYLFNRKIFPSYHAGTNCGKVAVPSLKDKLIQWRARKRAAQRDAQANIAQPETPAVPEGELET